MCPALLNHGLAPVRLHPALFPLTLPLWSLSLSVLPAALHVLSAKTLLITYPNYPNSLFDMSCFFLSILPLSLLPPSSFHCFGNSLLFPTSSSLTHSSLQSLSASHPPLCLYLSLSLLLVSKKAPEASVIHWLTFLCYI